MGFGCMEKNRSFPCGKSKMIGSHPPVVPASHYISLFMHSRQRRPLLVKAIRRRVEGPRTMPFEDRLLSTDSRRSFPFICNYPLSIYQSIVRTWMVSEGFHVQERRHDRMFV